MKIEISLTSDEYFLLAGAALHLSGNKPAFCLQPSALVVEEDFIDNIRDYLMDSLPVWGFDGNYQLNDMGRTMEHLIDKLFVDLSVYLRKATLYIEDLKIITKRQVIG